MNMATGRYLTNEDKLTISKKKKNYNNILVNVINIMNQIKLLLNDYL